MQRSIHNITVILILSIVSLPASSQKQVNSPYARFNLGMLEPAYNFRSAGMGGVAVSLRDNNSVSFNNPASCSSLDTNSFVFDFGLDYTMAFLKDKEHRHFSDDMNFNHLAIAFPLMKGVGMVAGITPYSNGYYSVSREITSDDSQYNPVAGDITIIHKGSGSISRAFLGAGAVLFQGFSAGVAMDIIFGNLSRINETLLGTDQNMFNSRLEENIHLGGLSFEAGTQYTLRLQEKKTFTAGLAYSLKGNYKSNYNNIFLRYTSSTVPPYSPDTLTISDSPGGVVKLPATISGGLSFNIEDKLTAAVEYSATRWSNISLPVTSALASSSNSIRAGVEYIPERYSLYNFFDRLEYRFGSYLSDSYLRLAGEQIKEFGITFGIGMPMARSWSKLNIFFDYNSRGGSLNKGLHRENCFTIGVSLNLYDYWFIKAKYD